MKAMGAVERLVCESEVSAAVLGRGRDFMLIRLDGDGELDPIELAEARSRGYTYAGVLSINRDGQPGAECESTPDAAVTMMHAALAFAQRESVRLRPPDDSAAWIERLHAIEDPRNG